MRYAAAVLLVILAIVVRKVLLAEVGMRAAFITFFPAVTIAAIFGGFWPGMLATALSAVAVDFFFLDPAFSFAITDPLDFLSLIIFVFSSTLICFVAKTMHRARAQLLAYQGLLQGQVDARNAELRERTSDLRKAEQESRESEERYRSLFEYANDAIIFYDTESGRIIDANASAARQLGYSRTELQGLSYEQIHRPEDLERVGRFIRGTRLNGSVTDEHIHIRKDGEQRVIEMTGSLFEHRGKRIFQSILRDITERRAVERALQKSEERFRAIVLASSDVLYRMTPDWSEMCQLSGQDFLADTTRPSRDWRREYIHPDDQSYVDAAINAAIQEKRVFALEHRVLQKDGSLGWTFSRAVPIMNEKGEIVEWFGTASNVTQQKQSEEDLRRSKDQLKAVNDHLEDLIRERTRQVRDLSKELTIAEQRERQRFSRILHEDLQQNLFGAKMLTDSIHCRSGADMEEIARDVEMLRKSIQKALATTKSLAVELNPPILKNEGLDAALRWLARHMEEHYGLVICIDLSKDLAAVRGVDQILIVQLMRELLFNIIKHAKTREVVISGNLEKDRIAITVEDRGVGFDVEAVRKRPYGAAEMGLFSIEERLRLFGGQLKMESQIGKGTRMTLVIPLSILESAPQ